MVNTQLTHWFKRFRAHQMATFGNSGLHIDGVDQRQFTGGGAAYGFHALAAFNSARSQIYFRKTFAADIAATRKRSMAAKKAWKKRRAA